MLRKNKQNEKTYGHFFYSAGILNHVRLTKRSSYVLISINIFGEGHLSLPGKLTKNRQLDKRYRLKKERLLKIQKSQLLKAHLQLLENRTIISIKTKILQFFPILEFYCLRT